MERAWETGDLIPLVQAAGRAAGDADVSRFLLAELVGRIVQERM